MKKLLRFCQNVYAPGLHAYFALNWFLALWAGLSLHRSVFVLDHRAPVAVGSMFLTLLFLRIVDELKDYDYDLRFNPDRPLVEGWVTPTDLRRYLLWLGVGVLGLNVFSGAGPLTILSIDLAYGLGLILLERSWQRAKHDVLLNLFFTYPVNVLLSLYVLKLYGGSLLSREGLLVIAFALGFLYYEFARKVSWPHQLSEGQRSYSQRLGLLEAMISTNAFALGALGILLYLYQSFLPLVLVFPIAWGVALFLRGRTSSKPFPMKAAGNAFLATFYGVLLTLGAIGFFKQDMDFLIGP